MHPVSCTNTHHDVTDSVMGWLKIQKFEYPENGTQVFYEIKKSLTCVLNDTILYDLVASNAHILKPLFHPL